MNREQNLLDNDLVIDDASISHLQEASMWGKFLSIIGFLYAAVVALGDISVWFVLSGILKNDHRQSAGNTGGSMIALLYLLAATVIFFMSLHLFRFAKKTKTALASYNNTELADALRNLKLYFRFAGIISIIVLVFTAIAIVAMMVAASFSKY